MLLKDIAREVRDFESKDIVIVPGFSFNQRKTIETDYFYYNSKFSTGDIDDEGDRKYFYNINKNPCKITTKSIDFDTKNIRILTDGGGDPLKTWFLERDLKCWMKKQNFGKTLNRLFKELPIYGSVVLKMVKGKPMFVDLRNFVLEQHVENISDSNYIIEIHNFTVEEFRKVAKQMGWENSAVEETVRLFRQMKDSAHIRVYERYGEVEEDNGDYVYKRLFMADVGVDEYDQYGNIKAEKEGVMLKEEEWEGNPYREFHLEKMGGRWLGIGVVESLYEPQIRQNELANLQSKASYWMALQIFQTQDPTLNRNLLTDVRNGEVLTADAPITKVDISERNLAFFNQETAKWLGNRDELTFSFDVVQGERLPAGTPLGSARLAVSQTLSYFEGIQEEVALDIKKLLFDDIMPHFEKDNTQEHTLRLIGDDLDQYIAMIKNELVMAEIVRIALNTGDVPTNSEKKAITLAIEEAIKQNKEKLLTIPKGFYENMKYDIDIDITGESVDTRVRQATMFALLQAITTDPTMTTDPVKKRFLFKMAEDGGINPNDLFDVEPTQPVDINPEMQRAGPGAGGGVSAPDLASPLQGAGEQTI